MRHKHLTAYDFDSDQDYYDYLDSLTKPNEEDYREPADNEPEDCYRETDDRNYPSNDIRYIND